MGGEAYVAFKPGLIDDVNAVTDGGPRQFLQSFMDRFAELAARLRNVETSSRAA
jgi:chromate reductase